MALGIHIFGASGSGTTTLGRAVAARLRCSHLDTDDYFWVPTDPPYVTIRPREERCRLLGADLDRVGGFVLSGSICGPGDYWGRPFVERFALAVFLRVPTAVRMRRLRERERERFGAALEPGGAMHEEHVAFLKWAEQYDTFPPTERSLALHEEWIATLACPVLRLDGERPAQELTDEVAAAWAGPTTAPRVERSGAGRTGGPNEAMMAKETVQCPR